MARKVGHQVARKVGHQMARFLVDRRARRATMRDRQAAGSPRMMAPAVKKWSTRKRPVCSATSTFNWASSCRYSFHATPMHLGHAADRLDVDLRAAGVAVLEHPGEVLHGQEEQLQPPVSDPRVLAEVQERGRLRATGAG